MKRIFLLSTLMCVLFLVPATAQIENEIKAFVDTTEIMVNNGRKLLIQKLTVKDDKKAREIYQYLESLNAGNNLLAFEYSENLYANLLLGNWEGLIFYMKEFDRQSTRPAYPVTDQLMKTLNERIYAENDSLFAQSRTAQVDDESKRIIELFLHLLKVGYPDEDYYKSLRNYHRTYRQSSFDNFLDNYLPRVKTKFGLGASAGPGMVMTTGNLSESFSSNVAIGLSMDFNINKIYTSLYMMGANLPSNISFSAVSPTDSLFFTKDDTFHYLEMGGKAGYFIVRNKRFHLAPYVSISGITMESTVFKDVEDDEREYNVINSLGYGPGIHSEIKLTEMKTNYPTIYSANTYWSIKLDAGYNMISKFDEPFFKGNTFTVSLAIVWGSGDF